MKRFCEASFILHLFFKSSSPLLLFLFWAGVSLGVTPIRIPHLSACPVGWVKLESSACLAFTLPHMTLTLPMTYWAINMAATQKGLGSDDIPVHIPLECVCVPLSKTRRSRFTDKILTVCFYSSFFFFTWKHRFKSNLITLHVHRKACTQNLHCILGGWRECCLHILYRLVRGIVH